MELSVSYITMRPFSSRNYYGKLEIVSTASYKVLILMLVELAQSVSFCFFFYLATFDASNFFTLGCCVYFCRVQLLNACYLEVPSL